MQAIHFMMIMFYFTIFQIYKISDEELETSKLLDGVVSRISSKEILTV